MRRRFMDPSGDWYLCSALLWPSERSQRATTYFEDLFNKWEGIPLDRMKYYGSIVLALTWPPDPAPQERAHCRRRWMEMRKNASPLIMFDERTSMAIFHRPTTSRGWGMNSRHVMTCHEHPPHPHELNKSFWWTPIDMKEIRAHWLTDVFSFCWCCCWLQTGCPKLRDETITIKFPRRYASKIQSPARRASSWGMRMGKWKREGKGDFSSVPLNMNTITIHHQVTGWLVYRISRGCGGGGEFILRWEWIVGGFVYLALLLHSTDPEEVTGIRFNISFRILHWPSVLWDAMRLLS